MHPYGGVGIAPVTARMIETAIEALARSKR